MSRSKTPNSLKTRLHDALHERGLSQATLAAILDVPRSSISNWLKSESIPTRHLIRLATELNISIDWLVTGDGPEKLFGPQYIGQKEKIFIESLRSLGNKFTDNYLQLLHSAVEPAYGPSPYETAGLSRFMDDTRVAWAVIGHDGRIMNASAALFELLEVDISNPKDLICTSAFHWIAEDYLGEAVAHFTRFLEGSRHNLEQPAVIKCQALTHFREPTELLTVYYTYEIHDDDRTKNQIHLIII